jgi:hypothetical protein
MSITFKNTGEGGSIRVVSGGVGSITISKTPVTSSLTYITSGLVIDLDAGSYSGTGNWLDSTANSNDATAVRTPTYSSNDGGYFDLDGGFYVISGTGQVDSFSIADDTTLDTMTSMSLEMWINVDTVQGSTSPNMLFSKRSLSTNGYVGFFTSTAYTFRVGTSSPTQLTWTTTPTTASWQQIVITVGSGGSKVYQNGTEVQDSPSYVGNFGNIDTNASLLIGDINPAATGVYGLDGKVSLFRMYNRILTPSEVQQNFDSIKSRYGI